MTPLPFENSEAIKKVMFLTEIEDKKQLEALINKEESRLSRNYAKIDPKARAVTRGLIKRAAFMRIQLEKMEEDLNKNGFTELFSQGGQAPYQRERPAARLYNSLNKNYQSIIKQLTDLLPKDVPVKEAGDGFEAFVSSREDV